MGDKISLLYKKGYEIYSPSDHLSFALNSKETIMLTPLACYEIMNSQLNSKHAYKRVRQAIREGEYRSLCDILTDMHLKPGIGISYRQIGIRSLYD